MTMKLYIVAILSVILQLTKVDSDLGDVHQSKGQENKFRRSIGDTPETLTENETDTTDLRDIMPAPVEGESSTTFSDYPTNTDVIVDNNIYFLPNIDYNLEGGYNIVPQSLPAQEKLDSLLISEFVPEVGITASVTDVGQQENTTPRLGADVGAIPEESFYIPDPALVKENTIFDVRRDGETPVDDIFIPVQEVINGDNPDPDLNRPTEIYYMRRDGIKPIEYTFIPIQDVVGVSETYLERDIILEDKNSTLNPDILNEDAIYPRQNLIPIQNVPQTDTPVLPIPYLLRNMRGENITDSIVFDGGENILKPLERMYKKTLENDTALNEVVHQLETIPNSKIYDETLNKLIISVDGVLRATGGGYQEEPKPENNSISVMQNKYPEILPIINVATQTFLNLNDTESVDVEKAKVEVPFTATTEDKIEGVADNAKLVDVDATLNDTLTTVTVTPSIIIRRMQTSVNIDASLTESLGDVNIITTPPTTKITSPPPSPKSTVTISTTPSPKMLKTPVVSVKTNTPNQAAAIKIQTVNNTPTKTKSPPVPPPKQPVNPKPKSPVKTSVPLAGPAIQTKSNVKSPPVSTDKMNATVTAAPLAKPAAAKQLTVVQTPAKKVPQPSANANPPVKTTPTQKAPTVASPPVKQPTNKNTPVKSGTVVPSTTAKPPVKTATIKPPAAVIKATPKQPDTVKTSTNAKTPVKSAPEAVKSNAPVKPAAPKPASTTVKSNAPVKPAAPKPASTTVKSNAPVKPAATKQTSPTVKSNAPVKVAPTTVKPAVKTATTTVKPVVKTASIQTKTTI